jgi:hypothetical protein
MTCLAYRVGVVDALILLMTCKPENIYRSLILAVEYHLVRLETACFDLAKKLPAATFLKEFNLGDPAPA